MLKDYALKHEQINQANSKLKYIYQNTCCDASNNSKIPGSDEACFAKAGNYLTLIAEQQKHSSEQHCGDLIRKVALRL